MAESISPSSVEPVASKPSRRGLRLQAKFFGVMALVALIVVVAGGLVGYTLQKKGLLEEFQIITRSIAGTAALQVVGDDLELIRSSKDAEEPEFLSIREKLEKVRKVNGLSEKEIYILRPKDVEKGLTEFVVMTDAKPFVGNLYTIRPENLSAFRDVLQKGEIQSTDIYVDEHGTWISSFAPVKNRAGQVVAVLEIDSEISKYIARVQREVATQALVAAAAFFLALIPGSFLVRRLTAGLVQLTQAMKQFKAGHSEVVRVEVKSGDEVEDLSGSFNSMASDLQQSTRSLLTANQELERSIAEVIRSKTELEAKTEELNRAYTITSTIMSTVQEGLFLLTPELTVEPNYSDALEKILGREKLAGVTFLDLIRNRVTAKTFELTDRFLKLAFNATKGNHVIGRLNPLKEIEFSVVLPNGEVQRRHLTFTFERVMREGSVQQLLVTVQDITLRVKLTKELRESSVKMERQAQLLMSVLHVEPTSLLDFIRDARVRLELISGILRREIEDNIRPVERQERYKQQVSEMLREIHRMKGNAAVLRIAYYENAAHDFETRLTELADRPALDGKDFLPVVVELSSTLQSLQDMGDVVTKLNATYGRNEINPSVVRGFGSEFSGFVQTMAQKLGKRAHYSASLDSLQTTQPALQQALKTMLIQFIRNSMTHGIESPAGRKAAGKPETGRIEVWSDVTPERIRVVYQDDGGGLDYDRLIERVKELEVSEPGLTASLVDPEKHEWKMAELGSIIFRPGFSTAEEITEDMGRGAGLDLVKTQVEALGGTISVLSQSGVNCLFVLDFPPNAGEGMEAPI